MEGLVAAFLEHYWTYLHSIKGSLALILLAVLIVVLRRRRKAESSAIPTREDIPGCFRAGLRKSRLDDEHVSRQLDRRDSKHDGTPFVKAIFTYPVKSCRGVELPATEISSTGLAYDRLFSFAQLVRQNDAVTAESRQVDADATPQWRFITQREYPKLALLETQLWLPDPHSHQQTSDANTSNEWVENGGGLVIKFPDERNTNGQAGYVTIKLPLEPTAQHAKAKQYTLENMTIWLDSPWCINMTNEIDVESLAKLGSFLGIEHTLALFRSNPRDLRSIQRSLPADHQDETFQVGFADAFQVHLLNMHSVQALSDEVPPEHKVDIGRFRANIIVAGVSAYEEDRWKRVVFGQTVDIETNAIVPASHHVACRTARCVLANVDQQTGVQDRKEPFKTLKRTRQVDEGAKPHPCFGLSMMPLFQRGVVRVGDRIEIIETGEHIYEKMFS
ncbi:Mitochondrial amidoxime reducing component 2 [Fulvia fulva]|uniref:Mitochondrial amidoxime reducing component 2 n=1 Tax=Passalora fulva TaxID=5499 RepID=A0A9Q8LCE9_PASFU|nr:Mitochondrial amidoxime reducing component 2 [Fulvia fulva]KAK4629533.1 Mitochondrial amidoxime reducing component 2 [Fulvia fulva]KAK4630052.1 Mitochondrial amidoxime reducing component 2 [Fulvia fulva]UJO14853.1 Mitochondrial amidoxime reducing component 2 [Fulvia fulva]WPV12047.1 Mitochondrial amidoxime reducing component 2 [Fulvia fulva]WPV27943.1 Mitochondrial amidoxime reducing component 2 [Fulvia fulva]